MPAKKSAKKAAKKSALKPAKKASTKKAAAKKAPAKKSASAGTQVATPEPDVIEAPPVAFAPDIAPARSQAGPSKQQQIRERAYFLYCDRMSHGRPGDAFSDWCQAERDLA